ncbi:uncharacterized protein LOC116846183 [Odontomachus brunneus]|uniref:uncharacterized protein LOC116846183 n=1 Tax=Odontomachus brunneus TaxID=486640 RepID=UPI0013F1AA55|nr:uncharacterized protein LOC116846183 [Odontomachus brunneus]
MDAFEELDKNEYFNIVQYSCNIGGFNVKEVITLCLKESIIDSMTLSYTWWGHKGHKPLYDTQLVMAIFDAVCKNPYFTKPSRQEFQRNVIEALRAAKKRVRSKKHGSRRPAAQENIARNFWKDRADPDDADLTDEN